jgi:uncharacterized protein (TIGR03118 family)
MNRQHNNPIAHHPQTWCEPLEQRRMLAASNSYDLTGLVSNKPAIPATHTDANLVNPWGIAINPANGAVWISDNGKGLSTAYGGDGTSLGVLVTIPGPGGVGQSTPTGAVFNGTSNFVVNKSGSSAPSTFLFATEDGTINGWNQTVDPANAVQEVSTPGAVYKGLTIARLRGRTAIFAANFHAGTIDVFNQHFLPVTLTHHAFQDRNLPAGFAPFNIATIHQQLFVTYAMQNAAKHDDVPGAGNGFVDVFNTQGRFLRRFASGGDLNSPWGITRAPAGSGFFAGDILVGNFGDGRINAFNMGGHLEAQLLTPSSGPVTIDGLWGLHFGDGRNAEPVTTLFFTSGPNSEGDGLFGTLTPSA